MASRSKPKSNGKPKLRIAALIRVSTEKQEKQGESLNVQDGQIKAAVNTLAGKITAQYGGQEHATAGWEKKELDRLLADAAKKNRPFDAVMVAHPDRWSRDNIASAVGLDLLQQNGVRFFVLTSEQDLFDPQVKLLLAMHAAMGAYHAMNQSKKSIESRIQRAKAGRPACGKLPFGRTFDTATGKWGIDPKGQAIITDVAKRYLKGERLADLAKEYGLNHSTLHKNLTKRCGEVWMQEFHDDKLNIHEDVPTKVPRLLPESVLKQIDRKIAKNKTFDHGTATNKYLLSGYLFCDHCGYALTGTPNTYGTLYYRHPKPTARVRACSGPIPNAHIAAADIEGVVIRHLFECFGNPVAVAKAVEAAIPNREEVAEMREQCSRIVDALKKVEAGRQRVIKLVGDDGDISDEDAKRQLAALRERQEKLQAELERLTKSLGGSPTPEAVKDVAKRVAESIRPRTSARAIAKKNMANTRLQEMTWEEQRELVTLVFEGTTVDGKPMGVYVRLANGQVNKHRKKWRYAIRGRLIDERGQLPLSPARLAAWEAFFGAPVQQARLIDKKSCVVDSVDYCRAEFPRGCHSCGRWLPAWA